MVSKRSYLMSVLVQLRVDHGSGRDDQLGSKSGLIVAVLCRSALVNSDLDW